MRITINVRVAFGPDYWDEDATSKEIEVKTEHNDYVPLPWAQICASLVEHTIDARFDVKEKKGTSND
jgi:hypothetical protein